MKIIFEKIHYDEKCAERFDAEIRGHISCCKHMEYSLNQASVGENAAGWGGPYITRNAQLNLWTDDSKEGCVTPSVRFEKLVTSAKHCPFCGEAVVAEELAA